MKKPLFLKLKKNLQQEGWNGKSITALLIFGAICVVFVFFGYSGKHNRIGTGAAAQVNATLVSVADLKSESQRMEQMYAPMFGGNIQEAQRQFIRQQALENLISTELMAQGSAKAGILVPDQEIRDVVMKEIPAFQDNGKFQRERYTAILQANHWTPGEFEARIRKERGTNRFRRALETVADPLSIEAQKIKTLREMQRNVDFVKIERAALIEKMPVSDSDVQKQLADANFLKKVQEEFDKNKAQYGSEEQVRAQHILIKAQPDNAESEKAALAKIEQIRQRAQKEDFGKLASELSEDSGSKQNKGDLGLFGHGKMVPEFEKAAFSQKVGEVGEPVKSTFGYHLIKVTEHRPAHEAQFESVRETIARKMVASEKYDQDIKKLEEALAAGDGSSVQNLVKEMGLTWQESGFFDLNSEVVPKLGSAVATQSAFEVSEKSPWSKKLARDAGSLYLIKWKAEKKQPLPAGEKVAEALERERSYELLNSWLEAQKKDATIERNTDLLFGRE